MSSVSPKPSVVTSPARPVLPSIKALVISVVACTIGAVMSLGRTPALSSRAATPRRTASSGADGVVSVLSTTTVPLAASSSTRSVNVPPMSTASLQSAISSLLGEVGAGGREHVEDPALVELVVADEDRVAVPDGTRREVRLAGVEHDPLLRVGVVADAEVDLAAHHHAQLLVVGVMVQEAAGGPAG